MRLTILNNNIINRWMKEVGPVDRRDNPLLHSPLTHNPGHPQPTESARLRGQSKLIPVVPSMRIKAIPVGKPPV